MMVACNMLTPDKLKAAGAVTPAANAVALRTAELRKAKLKETKKKWKKWKKEKLDHLTQ